MAVDDKGPSDGFEELRLSNINRENGGTQRRYRFTNGTTLVVRTAPDKRCIILPRSMHMVKVNCDRATAAHALAWGRHNRRLEG